MPWREERDAYRIWLSEVILQQTQVVQGERYYLRFLEAFPTVTDLAAAAEDEVLALWQGLGYYTRARNLHAAAKRVVAEGGQFPTRYDALLRLPGVGPYSAAAIASFSSGEAVAVLDGNVYRVLARVFAIDAPIDKPASQKRFREMATSLLPPNRAAAYNQAIMDFGATVCKPKAPLCPTCPLRDRCLAYAQGRVLELPVKAGKLRRRRRYFDYLHLVRLDGSILLRRRGAGDIWQGLYDMPAVETAAGFAEAETTPYLTNHGTRLQRTRAVAQAAAPQSQSPDLLSALYPDLAAQARLVSVTAPLKQQLSHQELVIRYWRYELQADVDIHAPDKRALQMLQDIGAVICEEEPRWVAPAHLADVGMPQGLLRYLHEGRLGLLL